MIFKLLQLKRSLITAVSTHRGYCAFKKRVAHPYKAQKSTKQAKGVPTRPTALLAFPGLPTRDSPRFLDDRLNHRGHDDLCMMLHLKASIQMTRYIDGMSFDLQQGWENMCTIHEEVGQWGGRARMAQQRPNLGLQDDTARFRQHQLAAEQRFRSCHEARESKEAELNRVKALLTNSIKSAFEAADAFYRQPPELPPSRATAVFREDDMETQLALLRFAENELRSSIMEVRSAGDRLLANEAALGGSAAERRGLVATLEYANTRVKACRTTYQEYTSKVLAGLQGRLQAQPYPVFPLTESNLKAKDSFAEDVEWKPEVQFEREEFRDEEGRPVERGGRYFSSAAPFVQETSGMYDRRSALAAAESRLLGIRQDHADDKALHFVLYPSADLETFEDVDEEGEEFEDRERQAMQDVEEARQLYETSRQIVQGEVEARPAPSESSLAAQISDYMDTTTADITLRRWSRRLVPTTPVRQWQGVIARECVPTNALQVAQTPASVTSLASVEYSEGISKGNGSDNSESGRTKRRRQTWLERRRPLGFDMNRYGLS